VLPSLYKPLAVNCWLVPNGVEALLGVTRIDTSVGAALKTVMLVDPATDPEVAVIVEEPVPVPEARPPVVMTAIEEFDELHVAELVRSCVLPSLNVPIAVNCWVVPNATEGFGGVTAIDCSVAPVIAKPPEPLTLPNVATTVTAPAPTEVANPCVGAELLIVATVPSPALQCTD